MKKTVQIFLFGFFLVALVDGAIQTYQYFTDPKKSPKPSHYSYSLVSKSGEALSNTEGSLLLALHPGLVYQNLPNQSEDRFTINSQGFRGVEFSEKKPNVKRMIVIGGSTAFGTGLDSNQETLEANLEKILANTEVINLATIGHMSRQELSILLEHIDELKPDLVVALNGWNDFALNWGFPLKDVYPGYGGFYQIQSALLEHARLNSDNFLIRATSNFINTFFYGTKQIIQKQSLATKKHEAQKNNEYLDEKTSSKEYVRNLLKMKQISESYGAKFHCFIQPDSRSLHPNRTENKFQAEKYDSFRKQVAELLERSALSCTDLNSFPNEIEFETFTDSIHFNADGYKAISKIIAKKIE